MTTMQISTLQIEIPRCVHGLSGPCNGTRLKRRYCKTLVVVRRWFLKADGNGWTSAAVAGLWCLVLTFTALMFMATISVYGMTMKSPTEERIEYMLANCMAQSGQSCELIMDAKPIPNSNYRF